MKKNLYRILSYFFILGLAFFGVMRLYYYLTDDFRLGNITYEMKGEAEWNPPLLSLDEKRRIDQILSQRFFYIGKGAQSYAFASEDQQYVLKFFKFKHLKPNFWLSLLPSIPPFEKYKIQSSERKKRKLYSVFQGYDLAYRKIKEGSGLLYIHLQPTPNLQLQVTLVDKMGLERHYQLDDLVFLLQKKGETLRHYMERELDRNRLDKAKEAFSKVVDMYISEYKKGIYDRDHGVMHNLGFIDGQPFHLDVGFLTEEETMQFMDVYKDDLAYVVWKINKWVKSNYPQYDSVLSEFLSDLYFAKTRTVYDADRIDPQKFKRKKEH